MILTSSRILWSLVLLPVVAWAHARHRTGSGTGRIAGIACIRMLVIACLILALAGPILPVRHQRAVEVAVVDVSASMAEESLVQVRRQLHERWSSPPGRGDRRSLVLFDSAARLIDEAWLTGGPLRPGAEPGAAGPAAGSALADALDLAASAIPLGAAGRVVLFSDGLPTGRDARAAAMRLGARGATLDVMPSGGLPAGDLILQSAELPPAIGVGATAGLRVVLESSREGPATITVRSPDPGEPPQQVAVRAQPGRHQHTIPLPMSRDGTRTYQVRCDAEWDRVPDNNAATIATRVLPPYRVSVIETDPGRRAAKALGQLLLPGAAVATLAPAEVSPATLKSADLVVLADTPADRLPLQAQRDILAAVDDGLGLLVTGGRQAFGPGGYQGTPLADALPVEFRQQLERRDPSVTLVIIIDTSGSMTGPRIALSKEVARLAVRRLQAHDKVGVVEFYGTKRWAARIQSAANAIDINRALNRLSAGGGTVILPAIEEAYYALLNVQTRFKHVLIITDGGVETGPFQEIITRMADAGITSSTVMVGPGQHSTFLSSLAHWGGGRFYFAPDRFHLPEVILKQPEEMPASPFIEHASPLKPADPRPPALADIDFTTAPPLAGYAWTRIKPQAEPLLTAANGDPILARWPCGRGAVAALTTDLGGTWSDELGRWPGWARLLSNMARQLTGLPDPLRIEPLVRPAGIEVRIEATGRTPVDPAAPLVLECRSPNRADRRFVLQPSGPGRWNHLVESQGEGTMEFRASVPGTPATGTAACAVQPTREFAATQPDRDLLEDLARLARQAARDTAGPGTVTEWFELWPWLVLACIPLTLAQVLIRRWAPRRVTGVTAAIVALVIGLPATPRADAASAPAGGRATTRPADLQGDLARTRQTLEAATRPGPADPALLSRLALYQELSGDDDAALATLETLAARTTDRQAAFRLDLRRACLLLDTGRRNEGRRVLQSLLRGNLSAADRWCCANLALLFNEPAIAVAVGAPASGNGHEFLLEGLAAQRAGQFDRAGQCFEAAAAAFAGKRDGRYAIQQIVSVARRRNDLTALADRWLQDPAPQPDRLFALAGILRELGRVDDLLRLAETGAGLPGCRAVVESPEFREQIIAAAVEAGKTEAAARMLEAFAHGSAAGLKWHIALARLWVTQGRQTEAGKLLTESIPAATQPAQMFDLANAARDLALDEVALSAVDRASRRWPDEAFAAGMWRARLAEKRGDVGRAVAELDRVASARPTDPGRLRELAQAYERYQQPGRAIDLLRQLAARTRDDDVQLRLAWLLEQTQQFEAARDAWRAIWENSATPALQNQAAGRLLDLAAKTNSIADLAIEFEEKLGQGAISARELNLLVDVYTQIGDDLSASEILYAFAKKSGQEAPALRQLSRAFLRMGRLAQAEGVLQRLLIIDPANAMEYLQEQTVLAVERQRPADAVVAIDRMTGLAGGESTAAELSAGVLGLIGDHEQAARSYAQVLAAHPEQVEVWLLWANEMRDSGQARRAIDRLSLLVDEADQDDLFLVAVDGLLNLEANGTPLKVALRRILERLAAGPQKIFLYDVAGDLLDTLGQRTRINPLMEQALVFAGEQRGSMLREMMDRAKADNRKADQIDYGSLLVGLGYDVPPTVLIELGETFLAQERRAEADRAFGRACSLGDYATIRQKVADAYDRALLPAPAQQILAELLITDPDNLALLHRDAGLLEQLGRYEEAFAAYERSLRILLGRTPQYRALASSSAPAGSPRRQRMAANLDEMAQFYDPTIESLIICARTDMLAARVVDLLNERATAEIEASAKIAEGRVLAQFPRLSRLAESVRWVSISLHRPQVADELDRRLLSRFPTDVALRRSALETRLAWGLGDRAARLAADLKISRPLPAIVAHDAASAPARLKAFLEAPGIDPAAAGTLVPLLIMTGQDDSARTVMDRCAAAWKKPAVDSTRTMLLAGVALNDPERTAGWLRRHLEVCGSTPDGDRLNDMISEGLRLAWNTLKPEQRATVLEDLERLAGRYTPRSARLDLLRLRLASRPADNGAARRTALLDAARQLADNEKGLVGMLQWLRPDERAAVLEQAWTAAKPAGKLDLLLAAAGAWTWPIDEATLAAFRRLLESGPAPRLDKFNPYSALVRSNWHRNTSRPEIGPVIADYLVAQLKSEPAVQVAAACSFATAGNSRRSSELAAAAVTALVANRKLETEQQRMIEDLVTCLPHGAGAPAWAGSPGTRPVDDASLIELFIAARYAAHTEQETAALEGLTRVFRRAGTNEAIRRALVDYLDSTRRMSALPGIMEPFLADRSIVQSFEISRIAEAYRLAQRPRDALRVFSQDSGTLSAIRTLELEAMLGRPDRIELILRRFLVTNRAERRFYTPLAARPPSVGGMKEYVVRRNTDAPRSFGVFNLLVPFASAVQELRMLWLTAEPDRRDLPGLCEAILAADRERHALAAVSARLEGWARDQSLHARDLYLLTAMLLAQETRLPPDVAENVRGRLMWVGADQVDALETSARLAVQAGHPEQAAAILRWVHAADLLSARKALDSVGPLRRLDLFLSCVPAGQRAAEFSRMARNWITTPLEEPNDRLDGMILRRLTEGDDTRLAGAALDAAREWLARLPAIAYMPRLHRACAYARLRGGEVNEAAPHIRELMRLCETAYGEQQPLDATAFLPPATQLADAAATAAGLRTLILSGLGDGKLSPTHATRSLVLLGQWCADNHLDAEAARALEAARTTAGDTPCERWLWIIDLARSIRPELAVGMEEQLLRANLLPVMRMSECLDDIERTSGRPRADRLALELHACTDLPAVLERAARQADAEHRPDEAAAIRRRLPAASRPAR